MTSNLVNKGAKKQTSGNQFKRKVYEGHDVDGLLDDFEGIGHSLLAEIKRRFPFIASDLIDGLTFKSFSSAFAMFFATYFATLSLATHIEQATYYRIGVSEYILINAVAGMIHSLFGAQPLLILRPSESTTLMIIFLSKTADMFGFDFYDLFAATGYFLGANLILISVTEASRFLRFVTRFTYELFIIFICSLYIYDGISDILNGFKRSSSINYSESGEDGSVSEAELGKNLFMACLAVITFSVALYLHHAVHWVVFTKDMRQVISDYALIVAVVISTLLSYSLSVAAKEVDRVDMPNGFGTTCMHSSTLDDAYATQQCFSTSSGLGENPRPWLGHYQPEMSIDIWILAFFCSLPISFLFFMDQNVAALLCQQTSNKLRKGSYYHYSFLILGIMNTVGPSFGLPFVSASSPHSHQFVRYLTTYNSDFTVRYVNENRLAPFLVYLLVGLSVFFPNLLGLIPLGTIRGVLTFIGVVGVTNCQLWDRFICLFRPPADFVEKYNRRGVAGFRVHLYTMLQICVFVCCWIINLSPGGIFVAFVIASLAPIRIYLLPFLFTENELSVLEDDLKDNALPRIVPRDTASALERAMQDCSVHSTATDASALPLMDSSAHEDDSMGRGSASLVLRVGVPAPGLPFSAPRVTFPEKAPVPTTRPPVSTSSYSPITTPSTEGALLTAISQSTSSKFPGPSASPLSSYAPLAESLSAAAGKASGLAMSVASSDLSQSSASSAITAPAYSSSSSFFEPLDRTHSTDDTVSESRYDSSFTASESVPTPSETVHADDSAPQSSAVHLETSAVTEVTKPSPESSAAVDDQSSVSTPVSISSVEATSGTVETEPAHVVMEPSPSVDVAPPAPTIAPVTTRLSGPIAGVLRAAVPLPPRPVSIGPNPLGAGPRLVGLPPGMTLPPRPVQRPPLMTSPVRPATPLTQLPTTSTPADVVTTSTIEGSANGVDPAPVATATTTPAPDASDTGSTTPTDETAAPSRQPDPHLLPVRPRANLPSPRPGVPPHLLPPGALLPGTVVGAPVGRPLLPPGRPFLPPRLPSGATPLTQRPPVLPPGVLALRPPPGVPRPTAGLPVGLVRPPLALTGPPRPPPSMTLPARPAPIPENADVVPPSSTPSDTGSS